MNSELKWYDHIEKDWREKEIVSESYILKDYHFPLFNIHITKNRFTNRLKPNQYKWVVNIDNSDIKTDFSETLEIAKNDSLAYAINYIESRLEIYKPHVKLSSKIKMKLT